MTWVKRDKTQTLVPLKVEWSGAQLRAKELLNRFLATDLTGREFLRQADKLSDGELRLLPGESPEHLSIVGAAADGDEPLHLAPDDDIAGAAVCPCMDATAGEILMHVRAGRCHVEVLKRSTSCGMGPCQGFPCWEMMRALIERAAPAEALGDRPSHRSPRRALTVEQAAALDGMLELE